MVGGMTPDQLQRLNERFRCKDDFYEYLEKVLHIYLPKKKNCSIQVSAFDCSPSQEHVRHVLEMGLRVTTHPFFISKQFLQAILANRKRYIRKFEHRQIKLPMWPELSIARIWPEASRLPITASIPS